MKQTILPTQPDAKSPAGADIRFIMDGPTGNMIHSTVSAGQTNRATVHATVSEFWHILDGQGEIWRRSGDEEYITSLTKGVSIDIPVDTAFSIGMLGTNPCGSFAYLCPRGRATMRPQLLKAHGRPHYDAAWRCPSDHPST
ncbi:cupin domain-containing protein [Pseudohalocynthiibacter aestuariivivens]|jgi:mannose-6-phosphate isomerase-like protein (cupin superfamily)|uniref:Cupin domain-containing protein n=1 Tax=Pseudohalocynthiibacter aestuariivivens TaxID=1591409 RepID=A0ABV5JAQ0_9RHOB|nr:MULTISPECIES: hypothetical protein [Pseudohalocynthiibacter]MCK0103331.1 hypothetical protein [Pseudohalocynthiibacter sp. F2068]